MSVLPDDSNEARIGVFYGLSAYLIWGFSAVYWKWLVEVGALEVLSHRVLWATLIIGTLLVARKRVPHIVMMVRDLRLLGLLVITGTLLAINWSLFIWAVLSDQILEASLGYYINPLVNVLIGTVLLSEKMSRLQVVAVGFAGLGVLAMLVFAGTIPWVALTLAVTFGVYGYLRKVSNVVAMDALLVELALFAPAAILVICWLTVSSEATFGPARPLLSVLLIGGGVVTLLPLIFFGESVRRVRLVTVGFLQYISPTIQFLLAVLLYGEIFSFAHVAAFGCIWTGLILYSIDGVRRETR